LRWSHQLGSRTVSRHLVDWGRGFVERPGNIGCSCSHMAQGGGFRQAHFTATIVCKILRT